MACHGDDGLTMEREDGSELELFVDTGAYMASIHGDELVCTDCHGAHEVHDPHEKQTMMSHSCATCHEVVYETYSDSVHGHALVDEANQDVPACADCYTAHSIADPTTVAFHLCSPEICVECHGDGEMMAGYDISPDGARRCHPVFKASRHRCCSVTKSRDLGGGCTWPTYSLRVLDRVLGCVDEALEGH